MVYVGVDGGGLFDGYLGLWLGYRSGVSVNNVDVVKCLVLFALLFTFGELEKIFGFKKAAFKDVDLIGCEFSGEIYSAEGNIERSFYVKRRSNSIVFFIRNYIVHFIANIYVGYGDKKIIVPTLVVGSRNWYSYGKESESLYYGISVDIFAGDYKLGLLLPMIPSINHVPVKIKVGDGFVSIDAECFCGMSEYVREIFGGVREIVKFLRERGSMVDEEYLARREELVEWLASKLEAMYDYGLVEKEGDIDWATVALEIVESIEANKLSTSEHATLAGLIFWFDQIHGVVDSIANERFKNVKDTRERRISALRYLFGELNRRVEGIAEEFRNEIAAYALTQYLEIGDGEVFVDARGLLGDDLYGKLAGLIDALRGVIDGGVGSLLGDAFAGMCDAFVHLVENVIGQIVNGLSSDVRSRISGYLENARSYYDKFKGWYDKNRGQIVGGGINVDILDDVLDALFNIGLVAKNYGTALTKIEKSVSNQDLLGLIRSARGVLEAHCNVRWLMYLCLRLYASIQRIKRDGNRVNLELFSFLRYSLSLLARESVIDQMKKSVEEIQQQEIKEKLSVASQNIESIIGEILIENEEFSFRETIRNTYKEIRKKARLFADYTATVQAVIQKHGEEKKLLTFRSTTGAFLGKLFCDTITALATRHSQTAQQARTRQIMFRKIVRMMPRFLRILIIDALTNELEKVGFSVFAKLLAFLAHLKNMHRRYPTLDEVHTFVDSLSDYEATFLLELVFGVEIAIDNRPPSTLRTLLIEKLWRWFEEARKREESSNPSTKRNKLSDFIKERYLGALGLEGIVSVRECLKLFKEGKIEEVREKFTEALRQSIDKIIADPTKHNSKKDRNTASFPSALWRL